MNLAINNNPQMLIEQTQNYYGLKADLTAAMEFISQHVQATPGAFYDWIMKKNKHILEKKRGRRR